MKSRTIATCGASFETTAARSPQDDVFLGEVMLREAFDTLTSSQDEGIPRRGFKTSKTSW
jgi:hypothetical protein